MPEQVFITGMGVVSPMGSSLKEIWANLESGYNPFDQLSTIDTSKYKSHCGAELKHIPIEEHIDANKARRMDRVSQMTVIAAIKAIEDAGLTDQLNNNARVGVVVGTGFGSTNYTDDFFVGMVNKGPLSANPMLFPNTVPNAAASYVSILLKLGGLNTTFSNKEISAEEAIVYAHRQMCLGHADVVLVGGADEISPFMFHAFSVTKTLAPRNPDLPEKMMPYDRKRNGLVLGEGAGVIVLETESHLNKRNGKNHGLLLASEVASEPVGILGYHPQAQDLHSAMAKALRNADLCTNDIDCFSGTANSTSLLDFAEAQAFQNLNRSSDKSVPVVGLKGHTGFFHGNGVLRIIYELMMMNENTVLKTANLDEPLEGVDLDYVMENRKTDIKTLMHTATSYGGTSITILLKKATQ